MKILGIDFETTGLDPLKDEIIEVGAVLWDTERSMPLQICSEIVKGEIKISKEIEELTKISNYDRENYGVSQSKLAVILADFIYDCDYIIAHNAKFDKSFLDAFINNIQGKSGDLLDIAFSNFEKPWIDSMLDIDYAFSNSKKLGYLAADHGFINPFAHRAVFDVLTMLKLASMYDWNETIENAKQPKIEVVANVSFENKDAAKKLGFHWENRLWVKMIRESSFEKESKAANDAGFKILKHQIKKNI